MTASSLGILLVVIYALGSGLWVSTGDGWYRSLNAPSWQPPDWIFGVIWPYNFIVLGISSVIVSQRLSKFTSVLWLACLAMSVVCALVWAYQFYRPHNLGVASIALAGAAAFTTPLLVIAYKASWPLLIALIPYQFWLVTAAFLSWGYQKRN
ncbi:MAG: tryptophan-rich sensory protein [Actinobacteria bacterium]|nr:tryptophan-rich sensory protein [Actinomycetota bacterium]